MLQFLPYSCDTSRILHGLPVMGDIAFLVEVPLAHNMRRKAQLPGDAIENVFDRHHSLRSAKPAKCSLRSLVRLANPSARIQRRKKIGIVAMKQRPPEHRFGQVKTPSAVG